MQDIRDTFQGLRKSKVSRKSFVWLPWQLFDNIVFFANEKQAIFKGFQKPQISMCQNKTLYNDSSIRLLFKKVILKWVGMTDFCEEQVENGSFSQSLGREFLQVVPDTSGHSIFHLFRRNSPPQISKAPKTVKKLFLDRFQTVPSFLTFSLALFWGKVSNFIMPPYLVIIKVTLVKILFSKLMPIQSYEGKTLRGSTNPPPPPPLGIRMVKMLWLPMM